MSTNINVRVTEKEKKLAEKVAKLLFLYGKIENETISDAMRQCLRFAAGELFKGIEAERYTG